MSRLKKLKRDCMCELTKPHKCFICKTKELESNLSDEEKERIKRESQKWKYYVYVEVEQLEV